MKRLDSIEIPTDPIEFGFFLNYNGEPAYEIVITNLDNDRIQPDDPTKQISSIFSVATMPIEGGDGEVARVTLYMRGKPPC